jgi:acylphosphatase
VARRAGVAGWVRNLPDGRVEALFEGAPEAVAKLVAFCREGPAWANVTRIAVTEEPPRDARGFEVRRA